MDRTADLLSKVAEWPADLDARVRAHVASWTPTERVEAMGWAGAVYLRASDNDDVYVPIEPLCVFALRQQIQCWRGDSLDGVTRMAPIPAGLSGI